MSFTNATPQPCDSVPPLCEPRTRCGTNHSSGNSYRYLARSDEPAPRLGLRMFEEAGLALLAISPKTETALELMKYRLQGVRARAIRDCLSHAKEVWARESLKKGAPQALEFRVG